MYVGSRGGDMELSTIIVAILALIGTLGGSYMANNKTTAVIEEKIKRLTERVEKHNQLVERTYKIESDLRTVFIRIDELREDLDKQ